FWPKAEREQIAAARSREDRDQTLARLPGRPPDRQHWMSWLTPMVEGKLPAGWREDEPRGVEWLRQVKANQEKLTARFFHATAIGESLLEGGKQERNN